MRTVRGCRSTGATATGTRFCPTPCRQMADDGVRRALAFVTSAYSSYSGCRQYRENVATGAGRGGGARAPGRQAARRSTTTRASSSRMARNLREALRRIPEERRGSRGRRRSPPTASRWRWPRAATTRPQLREACRLVAEAAGPERVRARVPEPQRPAHAALARARHPRPPEGPSRRRAARRRRRSDRLPLGPHGGRLRPRHARPPSGGPRSGSTWSAPPPSAWRPEFVSMIRELVLERVEGAERRPSANSARGGTSAPKTAACPAGAGRPSPVGSGRTAAMSPRASAPSTILFTGFPGFIGLRLLPALLELKADARVSCLVQEKFLPAGPRRCGRHREGARLTREDRIDLVTGDITRPGLGLEAAGGPEAPGGAWRSATTWPRSTTWPWGRARASHQRARHPARPRIPERRAAARATALRLDRVRLGHGARRLSRDRPRRGPGLQEPLRADEVRGRGGGPQERACLGPSIGRGSWWGTRARERRGSSTAPTTSCASWSCCLRPGVFAVPGGGGGTVEPGARRLRHRSAGSAFGDPCEPGQDLSPHRPRSRSLAAEITRLFARALGKRFLFLPVPLALAKLALRPLHRRIGLPLESLDYFDDPVRHDATEATRDLGALGIHCPRLEDYLPALVAFYRAERDRVRREAMI